MAWNAAHAQTTSPYDGQWTGKYQCNTYSFVTGYYSDVQAEMKSGQFTMRRSIKAGSSEILRGSVSQTGTIELSGGPDGAAKGLWRAKFKGDFQGEHFTASGTLQGEGGGTVNNSCTISLQRIPGTAPLIVAAPSPPNAPTIVTPPASPTPGTAVGVAPSRSAPQSTDGSTAIDELKRAETKAIQTALARLGLYEGTIDGIPGPQTTAAIKKWQTSRAVDATGTLSASEIKILTQALLAGPGQSSPDSAQQPSPAPKPKPTLMHDAIPQNRKSILSKDISAKLLNDLFSGENGDAIIFFNEANAPNAVRNLRGEIRFNSGLAAVCYLGVWPEDLNFDSWIVKLLKSDGIDTIVPTRLSARACGNIYDSRVDVIAVRRQFFDEGPITLVREILGQIEQKRISILRGLSYSQFSDLMSRRDQIATQNLTNIANGEVSGYGLLILSSAGRLTRTCTAISGDEILVKSILARLSESELRVDKVPNAQSEMTREDMDRLFVDAKRGGCGFIVDSASNLKVLVSAFKRDGIAFEAGPGWISVEDVEALRDKIRKQQLANQAAADLSHQRTEEEQRKLDAEVARKAEEDRIAAEQQKKLDEERKNAEEQRRQTQIVRMQALVRSRAQAVVDRVAEEIHAFIGNPAKAPLGAEFADFVREYRVRIDEKWEFSNVLAFIENYGKAEWRKRIVEAVSIRVQLPIINKVIGEKREACVVFSYINDEEFKMRRQFIMSDCARYSSDFSDWAVRNNFTSEWK
jgi:peptidoglycan hydrolase-like protein with peptidoglycan-binding domain